MHYTWQNMVYSKGVYWDIFLMPTFWKNPTCPTTEQCLNNDDLVTQEGIVKNMFLKTNYIEKFMM